EYQHWFPLAVAIDSDGWARGPDYIIDASGAGCEHDQPVQPQRDPAGVRHHRESGQKILVNRIPLAIDALFLQHLLLEPLALLGGIGELSTSVGKLDTTSVELKAVGEPRIGRLGPGQRGLDGGIVVKDCRLP